MINNIKNSFNTAFPQSDFPFRKEFFSYIEENKENEEMLVNFLQLINFSIEKSRKDKENILLHIQEILNQQGIKIKFTNPKDPF